jgi:uncharacterized OsmC-like protein
MIQIDIEYLNDLKCKVTHIPSGNYFLTDAPLDNQGKAEYISPTDLTAASIGSCIATIMGIKAKSNNIDLTGLKISVLKDMINHPRRISKIIVNIYFPKRYTEKEFSILENVVKTCPVSRSLSSEVIIEPNFYFPETE